MTRFALVFGTVVAVVVSITIVRDTGQVGAVSGAVLGALGPGAASDGVQQLPTVTEGPEDPAPLPTVTPELDDPIALPTSTPEATELPSLPTLTPDSDNPTPINTPKASPTDTPTSTNTPTPTFTPTFTPTPTPYPAILANISTRGFVGTGDFVLIPGFIVKSAPIRVVLRARGPFMASTVPGVLLDPQLQLFDNKTGTTLGMNDNWESGNCKTDVSAGFWPGDPREACLVATLPAGEYTFILSGVTNSTGVALGEVFRVDGAGVLSNISTRGLVLPEPRELIGGLIIQKSPMTVVIRGRSRSMAIPGVLCDPTLTLFDVTGKVLAKNDDWGQWPNPPPGFPPPDAKEALIAMTLPPGSYTAVLGSAQACTGIGLVEVFNTAP